MPYASANGIRIYYETYGDKGEWITFIMGLGMPSFGWERQVDFFKKDYKVLIFDNRGVGKSDKPMGPYTTRMMADDTISLLDSLNIEKAHFVGISMGGMIAQEIGINYPERAITLTLAATYAKADERITERIAEGAKALGGENPLDILNKGGITFDMVANFLLPFVLSKRFISENKILIKRLMERIMENPPEINSFFGQVMAIQMHNTVDRLSEIKNPTLVITGTSDMLVPPDNSDFLHRNITGSKIYKIKEGPHGINFENEKEFNDVLLEFINGRL